MNGPVLDTSSEMARVKRLLRLLILAHPGVNIAQTVIDRGIGRIDGPLLLELVQSAADVGFVEVDLSKHEVRQGKAGRNLERLLRILRGQLRKIGVQQHAAGQQVGSGRV